jgi:hypothetical protein
VHNIYVHIGHGAIVGEPAALPIAPVVAAAHITETIINPAIKPYMGPPISAMPAIAVLIEFPIRWRPKRTNIRGEHPDTGNPVIIGSRVIPVARGPHVVFPGA